MQVRATPPATARMGISKVFILCNAHAELVVFSCSWEELELQRRRSTAAGELLGERQMRERLIMSEPPSHPAHCPHSAHCCTAVIKRISQLQLHLPPNLLEAHCSSLCVLFSEHCPQLVSAAVTGSHLLCLVLVPMLHRVRAESHSPHPPHCSCETGEASTEVSTSPESSICMLTLTNQSAVVFHSDT